MKASDDFDIIDIVVSGYGLVVEHVLAKDETGVRFSLPALGASKINCLQVDFLATTCGEDVLTRTLINLSGGHGETRTPKDYSIRF